MKSALFFDIDGTLWNYDHYIPESTKEAIRLLRANGNYAFLCSGRARAFINHPDLLAMGWDGIVCSCGCHIEIDGKIRFEKLIELDEAVRVIEEVRSYGIKPILEGPDYLYMDDAEFPVGDSYGDILRRDLGDNLQTISGANYGKWKMNKFSCSTIVPEPDRLECLAKLRERYEVIEHDAAVIEVVPKDTTKATGMLMACDMLGIDHAHTYAFGDSENDLAMLEAAGIGVAMGNGTDRAKAAADYVTDDFDKDGIYNACRHFGLI